VLAIFAAFAEVAGMQVGTPSSTDKQLNSPKPQTQSSGNDAAELAKKLANPLAALISLPFQNNFDFNMGPGGDGWRYTLNIQPVIPIALNPKWNLISRTILPIMHQSNVTGEGESQTGLGDVAQSFWLSPNKSEPLIWGVGPIVNIPTATNGALGGRQLGLGPTVVALKQTHGWTYGMLWNHVWGVTHSDSHPHLNATFFQPFLTYGTKSAWTYALNTESTYDWTGGHWSVPINASVSKLVHFGKHPFSFQGGIKCWVTTPLNGPEGCGPRFVVTALFPKH
jgi:hypothetical protein